MAPDQLVDLVAALAPLPHLQIRGLMTIAAHSEDEATVRGCFRTLRTLGEKVVECQFAGVSMDYLSMGMSGDFELAIAEGPIYCASARRSSARADLMHRR